MEAVIISGPQGAGTSTYCRLHYWDTHVRINYDMLRTRHRELLLLNACLAAKQPFVVDATNPLPENRARYILPSRAAGFRIIGLEFRVIADLALARNATREGKARVPDKAVWATLKKMQPLAYSEGFDEIWLTVGNDSEFTLLPVVPPRTPA